MQPTGKKKNYNINVEIRLTFPPRWEFLREDAASEVSLFTEGSGGDIDTSHTKPPL